MNKEEQNESAEMAILPELHFNPDNHQPCVSVAGQMHHTLAGLIAAHPNFGRTDRLSYYCRLLLHFHLGPGCVLIEDANEFRARYRELQKLTMPVGSPLINVEQIPPPPEEQAATPDAPPPLDPALFETDVPEAGDALFLQPALDDTTPADFGPFDLSEIAPPRIEKGKLIFYAEQVRHCIPYRVEAPWPVSYEGEVNFMLLPLP